MTEPSSITVVVPLYNGARYLADAMRCLAAQTRRGFSVLYVDDGSTDDSADIVAAAKQPGDRLVRKPNSGLYDTLNFAAGLVETEWMALFFQDDLVRPTWIEGMAAGLDDSVDCLWFAVDTIGAAGNLQTSGLNTARREVIPPSVAAWQSALRRGTFWTISGSVLKTSVVRKMCFRPDLPHCGDYEFLLRGLRALTFVYVEQSEVAIRVHPAAASAGNLARGRDLAERFVILAEQRQAAGQSMPAMFRARLARHLVSQIIRRAGGAVRRGEGRQAFKLLTMLPGVRVLV